MKDLRDIKKEPEEDEKQFPRRTNEAYSCCSIVFLLTEVTNIYIGELAPASNSFVQRFRNIREGCMYVEVVLQAKSVDDTLRSRTELPCRDPYEELYP